jgi:hypothetical protein
LLDLSVEAAQVDKVRDLVLPNTIIVQERVTNGRNLGSLLRRASRSFVGPGRRHHCGSTKHRSVTQQVSTVRRPVPLIEQPERLGRGLVQLTHYATQWRAGPALAPLPAAELGAGEDQTVQAKPVGNPLGLPRGVVLGPAAPLPLEREVVVGLPAPCSWHRAAPLRGCLR